MRSDNKGGRPFIGEGNMTPDTSPIYENTTETVGVRELAPPGTVFDELYLSREDREEMGISDAVLTCEIQGALNARSDAERDAILGALPGKYVVGMVRDHNDPSFRNMTPRIRELKRKYSEVKIVTVKGEAQGHHDQIYVLIPRDDYMEQLKRHDKATDEFTRQLIEGRDIGDKEQFPNDTEGRVRERAKAHATLRSPGMMEKWPKQMTLEDIEKHMGPEETIRIERMAARGGRGERPGEYERYEERREQERAAEADRAKRSKNRTYSLPGSPTR